MKPTKATPAAPEEFKTLADESSTSTSDTGSFDTLGSNVERTEPGKKKAEAKPEYRPLPPRDAVIKHVMEKRKNKGKDFWVCTGCQYSTYNASSASQHSNER